MNQAPPSDRRPAVRDHTPVEADESSGDSSDDESAGLKELVETAASAYFGACRQLARTISRLKSR